MPIARLQGWLVAAIAVQLCCCILAASTDNDRTAPAAAGTTATMATSSPEAAEEDALPDEDFTPEQLAKAGERLGQLFDESLDANADGKVTRAELTAWLAAAEHERADKDLDEAWQLYATPGSGHDNSSDSSDSNKTRLLDWQTFADARAAAAAVVDSGQPSAELQAEVRRAIDEASKETGLDKAGIRVSLPGGDQGSGSSSSGNSEQTSKAQRQLALELARDRRRWEAADANGDGRLSRQEFAAFALAEPSSAGATSPQLRRVLALEALERLDTDGDGRASLREFLTGGASASDASGAAGRSEDEKNFRNVWDVNKDGYMDADEMEKMLAALDSVEVGSVGGDDANEEAGRLMKEADTDGDGSLSKAEVLASLGTFAGSAATNYGDSVGIHDEL